MPFIKIDPVSIKDFRKQKINILNHTAIIFTSRNAVDHFFRIAEGMNVTVPTDMKYFCISEQTANYLQKYIVIRKRKIFTGERTIAELLDVMKETMKKFPDEKYLFPCSNITRDTISDFLKDNECTFSEASENVHSLSFKKSEIVSLVMFEQGNKYFSSGNFFIVSFITSNSSAMVLSPVNIFLFLITIYF